MMFRFTQGAKQDFIEISAYIAQDNPKAAESVQDAILETCQLLSESPEIGRHPDYIINPEIHFFRVKQYESYLIFYRKVTKGIEIVSIIHGARDLPDLLN